LHKLRLDIIAHSSQPSHVPTFECERYKGEAVKSNRLEIRKQDTFEPRRASMPKRSVRNRILQQKSLRISRSDFGRLTSMHSSLIYWNNFHAIVECGMGKVKEKSANWFKR